MTDQIPSNSLIGRVDRFLENRWLQTAARSIDTIGKFAIVFAVFLWIWETPLRRQQRHDNSWTLINLAHGKRGEAGRQRAIENLNYDNVSLAGIDLSEAFLNEINLPCANLVQVNFDNSEIIGAGFDCGLLRYIKRGRNTILYRASFKRANFSFASFKDADLSEAFMEAGDRPSTSVNFSGANFRKTRLKGNLFTNSSFERTIFAETIFDNVKFSGEKPSEVRDEDFRDAYFFNVNLMETDLSVDVLRLAKLCNAIIGGNIVNKSCPNIKDSSETMPP